MEDEFINEDEDFLNKANQESVVQKVCQNIDLNNGAIKELKNRQASVMLETTSKMILDKSGLVHTGNLYSSAAYSALLAVNNPNAIIIGVEMKFLAPILSFN